MAAEANGYDLWIAIAAATSAVMVALGPPLLFLVRRLGHAERRAEEARIAAAAATATGREIRNAVGEPNGNGTILQIVERILAGQFETFAWQRDHEIKDDQMRTEVRGLHERLMPRSDD